MANMLEVVEGLQILSRYCYANDHGSIEAGHDIIYVGPENFDFGSMSEKDLNRMRKLGWHQDYVYDCWARLV